MFVANYQPIEDFKLASCTVLGEIKLGMGLYRLRFAETGSKIPNLSFCDKLTELDIAGASPEGLFISSYPNLQS